MKDITRKILVADDEESIRFTFTDFLTEADYQVETPHSPSSCITKKQSGCFDLLFLDVLFGVENDIRQLKG